MSSHYNSFKAYYLGLEESLYDEMKQFVTMVQARKTKKFIKHPVDVLLDMIFFQIFMWRSEFF